MADETKVEFSGYSGAPRIYVNGVWGGPLTRDVLVVHCLFKHVTPPENLTLDLQTGKQIGHEGVVDTNEVMATLLIPPEEAVSIGEWMVRHGNTMIQEKKGQALPAGVTMQ